MKETSKVAKNTGWILSAKLTARIFTAIFIILLANHLLPESFGIYNFLIAISYLFAVIADFGFDELSVREVSKDKSRAPDIVGNILGLRSVLSIVMITALIGAYFFIDKYIPLDVSISLVLVAGGMLVMEKFGNIYIAQFQAVEKMKFQAIVSFTSKIVYLGMGIGAIILGFDLFKILVFLLIAYAFRFLFSTLIYLRSMDGSINTPSVSNWSSLLSESSPFALFTGINVVYGQVIIVILAMIASDYQTGLYSASWKIIVFLGVIPYSFSRAIYPVFSRLYSSKSERLRHAYKDSLRYLLVLSLPLTLGLYVLAPEFISVLYTTEYIETVRVFKTIVWMLPFLFMNGSLKMVLWSSERTTDSSKNLFVASLVLIVSGIFLIDIYGAYGAAVAIVLAEIVHFLLNFHHVNHMLSAMPVSHVWKPYLSSLFMAGLLYLPTLLSFELSALWLLPLGIALYFLILYALKGIRKDDIKIIKDMI